MKELTRKILSIGLGAIISASIVFGVMNGLHKREIREIQNQTNIRVQEVVMERNAIIAENDSIVDLLALYKAKNDSLDHLDHLHRVEIDNLKEELVDVLNDMWDQYLEDQGLYAYDYLRGRYYSEDTLRYLFSGEQVTYMASDIIKGDYLDSLIQIEQTRIMELNNKVLNFKDMVTILNDHNKKLLEKNIDLSEELEGWIRKQGLTEEENAWLRKKLNTWRAAGLSTVAIAALLLILL